MVLLQRFSQFLLDIDECQDPSIAARCVENAECCNLPAHFVCKCKPGFEGDGEELCTDVNECAQPGACGINADCINVPGNHTCACRNGYEGNPFDGCVDINECIHPNACGPGAMCINLDGSYQCECPHGFDGDARANGCQDMDECARSPCGRNAQCRNSEGSFQCMCPEGFVGDPMNECQDINECLENPCGANALCSNSPGSFLCTCKPDYTGNPYKGCSDIDECSALKQPCPPTAICENANPGYNCKCPQGYAARPDPKIACEQVDVNILCQSNFDCTTNAECIEGQCFCQNGFEPQGSVCVDIDECRTNANICGDRSMCINTPGSHRCECPNGLVGAPPRIQCKAPCEDVKCGIHSYCKADGTEAYCVCDEGWTYNPNDIAAGCQDINECDAIHGPSGRCGLNAICTNTPGGFSCQCPVGFSGNADIQCVDIDECSKPNRCGPGALCLNRAGSFECVCPEGSIPDPDPNVRCITVVTCKSNNDCPGNAICDEHQRCLCPTPNIGNDCRHPCEGLSCGPNSNCMLVNQEAKCLCSPGFVGSADRIGGCVDDDECKHTPSVCPEGSLCVNTPGSFTCQCPSGILGDPFKGGCARSNIALSCDEENPCSRDENCVVDGYLGKNACVCRQGFTRDPQSGKVRNIYV